MRREAQGGRWGKTQAMSCIDLCLSGDGVVQRVVETTACQGDGGQLGGSAQAEGHSTIREMEKVMSLRNNVSQRNEL